MTPIPRSKMSHAEAGRLGAAVRLCREFGRCIYPDCEQTPAPCWTPEQLAEAGARADIIEVPCKHPDRCLCDKAANGHEVTVIHMADEHVRIDFLSDNKSATTEEFRMIGFKWEPGDDEITYIDEVIKP